MQSTQNYNRNRDSSSYSSLEHHQHPHPLQYLAPIASNQLRERDPDPDRITTVGVSVSVNVRYRECMKNHAASMGSHVVDGCGEFMPSGEQGTAESFTCAACNCHRNFHRKHRNINNIIPYSLHQHHRFIPPLMGGGGGGQDLHVFQSNTGVQPKKRFRTKFTEEQKEKMMEFADKLGWKIHKHHDQQLRNFCSQVGVKRKVFKVWMHNNKQARKHQHQQV